MKRILSIALTVCMLLSTLALFTVHSFAVTTDASEAQNGKSFRIGAEGSGTYYDTLESALAALKDTGGTIVMIADYKQTARFSSNETLLSVTGADKAIVINGNNHTLTMDDGSNDNAFFYNFTADLTFQNMTLVIRSGIRPQAYDGDNTESSLTITFENCKVESCAVLSDENTYEPSGRSYSFCVDRIGVNIVLKNTTFNVYGEDRFIGANRYGVLNVTLENSSVKFPSNAKTIQMIELWHHSARAVFNLDGTSKIVTDTIQLKTDDHSTLFESQHANNSYTLNLAAGAEISILNTETPFSTYVFGTTGGKAPAGVCTVNDNGAKWTIGKDVLTSGIVLPTNVSYKGAANTVGWNIGGKLYAANGQLLKMSGVTENATITPVCIGEDALTNVAGASIRTADPYGIRFTTKLSADAYNTLSAYASSITYATLIAESSKLNAETPVMSVDALGEGNYTIVKRAKWVEENVNGVYTYRGAFYALEDSKACFNTSYSATGCIVIEYADGTVGYVYAAFDKTENSRTICAVAQAAIAAGTTDNTMLNHIVATATAA